MINRWAKPEYMPTPAEIQKACETIQLGWTENERQRRSRFLTAESTSDGDYDFAPAGETPRVHAMIRG